MLLGDSGEPGYFSLRSESVPYPLSTSIVLADLGSADFGGHVVSVRGLTATDDSLDCAWLTVAASAHRWMILAQTPKLGEDESSNF